MFDDEEEEIDGIGSEKEKGDLDDFNYYVSYIKALEDEQFSKGEIARSLMEEFDLEKDEAVKIVKRYYAEKDKYGDDDEEADIVEDDDYGDGNISEF